MDRASRPRPTNDPLRTSERSSQDSDLPSAYDRGVRDSKQRLHALITQNYAEPTNHSFLPGISQSNQPSRAPPSPPDSPKHKGIELPRPPLARSRSTHEEPVSPTPAGHARPRNRTVTDITWQHTRQDSNPPKPLSPIRDESRLHKQTNSSHQTVLQLPSDASSSLTPDLSETQNGFLRLDSPALPKGLHQAQVTPPSAKFISHLMNRTRGQMQGMLCYREESATVWNQAYCLSASCGSLLANSSHGRLGNEKLIADLHGCQVQAVRNQVTGERTLHVAARGQQNEYQLRPADASEFHAWFAAFSCWQAVKRKKSFELDLPDVQLTPVSIATRREKRHTKDDKSISRESTIVKVAKLGLWNREDTLEPIFREFGPNTQRRASGPSSNWTKVSCMLHEGGEFRVMTTTDVRELAMIPLSRLPRSSIQRSCSSVLKCEHVIAILPQYSTHLQGQTHLQPLYLRCESRPQYELWFVLLRAFTIPELYGPPISKDADSLRSPEALPGLSQGSVSSFFRVERSLVLNIGEYRTGILTDISGVNDEETDGAKSELGVSIEYFAQVLIDGIVRAKTRPKPGSGNVAWFENIELSELPPTASFVTIQVRKLSGMPSPENDHTQGSASASTAGASTLSDDVNMINELVAEMAFPLNCTSGDSDKKWPLIDEEGEGMKTLSLKARLDRSVVLADREYSVLSALLHNFTNPLTLQLADVLPGDLKRLSECLLSIFQVSGSARDWITSLIEEEIDNIRSDAPTRRFHYGGRLSSNESKESLAPHDREGFTRDMTRATIAEANLLFRGNTLLSKALDSHMQRLGREYLEDTLGAKLREIAELDQDVEVDPSKLSATASLHYNWLRLHELVRSVWSLIRSSAQKCPPELRTIFRHIKACAEEKYGHCLKTVPYSSVSGFLFLRFFCPALLNPLLFDLVHDSPRPRATRGFVLIAKTLQGLANQSAFGSKEPWMEPMNYFLNQNKKDFRDFIDEICVYASAGQASSSSQYYSAALSTFSRLPTACKEGYLSLPYLIDETRGFAALVDLWLDNFTYQSTQQPLDSDLLQFHNECLNLRKKTQDLFRRAERGAKRSSLLEEKWNTLAQLMETSPEDFWTGFSGPSVMEQSDVRHVTTRPFIAEEQLERSLPQPTARAAERSENGEEELATDRLGASFSTLTTQSLRIGKKGRQSSMKQRFRSRSRSRNASPLRTGEYDSAASGPDEDSIVPNESGGEKLKSKEKQRHGLFGRRRKSEK